MATKSSFLVQVLKRADTLRKNGGRNAISSNYFVLALLSVLDAYDKDQLTGEEKEAISPQEINDIKEMLTKAELDRGTSISVLKETLNASGYDSFIDELVFEKILFVANESADRSESGSLEVRSLLDMILHEPSCAIRECLKASEEALAKPDQFDEDIGFFKKQSAPSSQESGQTDGLASDESIKKTVDSRGEEVAENPDESVSCTEESDPAHSDLNGIRRLAQTVQNTQRIQKTLLENVFGQDQAVNAFVSGYFQAELMSHSRSEDKKPQATFLFAGPPGVGKTFLAETAAQTLGLPYMRFDMSEYADKEANIEFCGSDKVYKNGKAGNVTSFVSENPRCVLLFDEIEKAHINVIYLFLQILDAGRIRDNFTDEEVSFTNAVLIFTTNVGKNLYEDPTVANLSALPRKKILKALAADVDPATQAPLFPAAICSRFASGNVVMFNHLGASNLFTIAKKELGKNVSGFEKSTGIKINIDDKVPTAIMLSEGGKADARTVKGRANSFFHEELYELFRLLSSSKIAGAVEDLKEINIDVSLDSPEEGIQKMFVNSSQPEVLIFADGAFSSVCTNKLSNITCHTANTLETAKEILFNYDISTVLCDINCSVKDTHINVMNVEDVESVGHDFMNYVLSRHSLPVYLLQEKEGDISQEEYLSFAKIGVRDILTANESFTDQVLQVCDMAYQQGNMLKLARENKLVSYKTSQTISQDKSAATIHLFDFKLGLATDTEDSKNILDNVAKPNLHFDDVIGAEDAKKELTYFVEYLKDPIKFMRRGVRAPKGILLYGPPGTGKTLLAKAMAGESDVTFLTAEGNQFLKKYVGEGSEAVHAIFNSARKYAPSILFIDEIDAIGKDRNSNTGNDSTGDVLTAFLTEMDGFNTDTSKPVFVLAATNYSVEPGQGKSLDPALLRRFDRRIYVDLPNKEERKRYLKMKAAKNRSVQLSEEQIENIALRSTGMSLAELESIFEMALRNAIRSESGIVSDTAFEEAFETFNSGEKKEWNPVLLKRTARHEEGHALLCWLSGEKPSYLTIVARGSHGGYMQHGDNEGKALYTKAELLSRIRTSLAGRAAEIAYYGEEDGISTGASGDLYTATRIAEQMICNYAMDSTVGMSYMDVANIGSDGQFRDRVNVILSDELENAIKLIQKQKSAIDALVSALMERNHLKEKEIDDILSSNVVRF